MLSWPSTCFASHYHCAPPSTQRCRRGMTWLSGLMAPFWTYWIPNPHGSKVMERRGRNDHRASNRTLVQISFNTVNLSPVSSSSSSLLLLVGLLLLVVRLTHLLRFSRIGVAGGRRSQLRARKNGLDRTYAFSLSLHGNPMDHEGRFAPRSIPPPGCCCGAASPSIVYEVQDTGLMNLCLS
jgi:hypothetical protein